MNHFRMIVILYLYLVLSSCYRTDETVNYVWEPYYINLSNQPIEIDVLILDDGHSQNFTKILYTGDTLNRTLSETLLDDTLPFYIPSTDTTCGLLTNDCDPASVTFSIRFIEDNLCLKFEGPINDSLKDLRSWEAYTRIGIIPNSGSFVQGIHYEAIIDSSYLAMAIPCGDDLL